MLCFALLSWMDILHCIIKKFFQNAGFRPYCWQGCPRTFHNFVACKWLSQDWFLNSVRRKEVIPLWLQTQAVLWSSVSTTNKLILDHHLALYCYVLLEKNPEGKTLILKSIKPYCSLISATSLNLTPIQTKMVRSVIILFI